MRAPNEWVMKLIIVQRSQTATYRRLVEKFADDRNVKVIFDRRLTHERGAGNDTPKSSQERRRLQKSFGGRDYIVVHVADPK